MAAPTQSFTVQKANGSFGFKLTGMKLPLSMSITPGGAAEKAGLTNDHYLMGLEHESSHDGSMAALVKLIKAAGNEITIVVRDSRKAIEGVTISATADDEDQSVAEAAPPTTAEAEDQGVAQSATSATDASEAAITETEVAQDEATATQLESPAKTEIDEAVVTEGTAVADAQAADAEAAPTDKTEPETPNQDLVSDGDRDLAVVPEVKESVVVVDVAGVSLHGTRHGAQNQDIFCFHHISAPNDSPATVAAVFDGHGLLGEVAAQQAAECLESLLPSFDWVLLASDPTVFMQQLFEQLDASVLAAHANPPAQYEYISSGNAMQFELKSDVLVELGGGYVCPEHTYIPPRPIDFGCTAVVMVHVGDCVVVGNAGDAAALLALRNQPDVDVRDGCTIDVPSAKHTASNPVEQERIERDFPGCAFFTPDGYLAPTNSVLSQYEVQLSRSLGHKLLKQAGVVATPDVAVHTLEKGTAFAMVLCSDGVTDELQPTDILDRVMQGCSSQDAATTLCNDAQAYCMEEDKIDDTTAIVVYFALP